ncbi:MAG: alpha/beta fold hydrolase [Chloroflexi bacterium CFX4]|nr:alpha/beta fold hydrolase [Chloroflexi bacterium CFX4]MDL1922868.1 alpha/beta fold hydrolase [Chloroflexi bacterium CFX3]
MSLHVQEYGNPNAPSLVFLHALGFSSWMWTAQIEALQSDFHCLTIDLPANGESYRTEWQSFRHTADLIAPIIQQRTAQGKAHLIGLSLGGYAALHMLAAYPDLLESVLVSGVTAHPFKPVWRWITAVTVPLMTWRPLATFNARIMGRLMQLPPEVAPLYLRDAQRASRRSYARVYAEVLTFEAAPSAAHKRLLVVAGDQEVRTIQESLRTFAAFPNTQAALVPKAHHAWNGEQPELFTEMIRAWVNYADLPSALQVVQPAAQPVIA